jgi:hypothetical protein
MLIEKFHIRLKKFANISLIKILNDDKIQNNLKLEVNMDNSNNKEKSITNEDECETNNSLLKKPETKPINDNKTNQLLLKIIDRNKS